MKLGRILFRTISFIKYTCWYYKDFLFQVLWDWDVFHFCTFIPIYVLTLYFKLNLLHYCIVFLQSIGSYHWWWWWRSDKRGCKTSCSGIYCALWNRWSKSVYKKKERRKIKERGILAIIIIFCHWLRYLIYKSHLCNPLYVE